MVGDKVDRLHAKAAAAAEKRAVEAIRRSFAAASHARQETIAQAEAEANTLLAKSKKEAGERLAAARTEADALLADSQKEAKAQLAAARTEAEAPQKEAKRQAAHQLEESAEVAEVSSSNGAFLRAMERDS